MLFTNDEGGCAMQGNRAPSLILIIDDRLCPVLPPPWMRVLAYRLSQ